jgi:hypothetical protein
MVEFKIDKGRGKTLPIKYNKKSIIVRTAKVEGNKKARISDILKVVEKIQEQGIKLGKDKEYKLMLTLPYGEGYRSGKVFDFDETPKFYDPQTGSGTAPEDLKKFGKKSTTFNSFQIYFLPFGDKKGGAIPFNDLNDCMFDSLKSAICCKFPASWDDPWKFKQRLGLNRKEMVGLEHIPQIEEVLKLNINVSGDHTYTSNNRFNTRSVSLILSNNHYYLDTDKRDKLFKARYSFKKPIAFFRAVDGIVYCSSGDKDWTFINNGEFQDKKDYRFVKSRDMTKSVRDDYDDFCKDREVLLKESNGKIDMFKTPNPKDAVLLAISYQTMTMDTEPLTKQESIWTKEASGGGIKYAKKGKYKNVKSVDQNGMYSYYLGESPFTFPVKQGEFMTVDNDYIKDFAPVGVYRCIIESTDEENDKFFTYNRYNKYTQNSINHAYELGFKVTMIQDGEANALIYGAKTRIQSKQLFNKLVQELQQLKKKTKIPFVKEMMSRLWGSLSENHKNVLIVRDEEQNIDDADILSIQTNKNHLRVKYRKYGDPIYIHNYARIAPFLTSYTNLKFSQFMRENIKDTSKIYRINTDSFITDIDNEINNIGGELGQFKLEKSGNCKIKHVYKVKWN